MIGRPFLAHVHRVLDEREHFADFFRSVSTNGKNFVKLANFISFAVRQPRRGGILITRPSQPPRRPLAAPLKQPFQTLILVRIRGDAITRIWNSEMLMKYLSVRFVRSCAHASACHVFYVMRESVWVYIMLERKALNFAQSWRRSSAVLFFQLSLLRMIVRLATRRQRQGSSLMIAPLGMVRRALPLCLCAPHVKSKIPQRAGY